MKRFSIYNKHMGKLILGLIIINVLAFLAHVILVLTNTNKIFSYSIPCHLFLPNLAFIVSFLTLISTSFVNGVKIFHTKNKAQKSIFVSNIVIGLGALFCFFVLYIFVSMIFFFSSGLCLISYPLPSLN